MTRSVSTVFRVEVDAKSLKMRMGSLPNREREFGGKKMSKLLMPASIRRDDHRVAVLRKFGSPEKKAC